MILCDGIFTNITKSHILILMLQRIVSDASILVFHQIEIRIENGLGQWNVNVFALSTTVSVTAVEVIQKCGEKNELNYVLKMIENRYEC